MSYDSIKRGNSKRKTESKEKFKQKRLNFFLCMIFYARNESLLRLLLMQEKML